MRQFNLGRAILAGLIGTAVMTVLTVMAGLMGVRMDIPAMLSGFMKLPIAVGWIAHFMIGTILALIYAAAFADRLPGAPWLQGALYGVVPFAVAQIAVMPMMGMGFFTANAPNQMMVVVGSLFGHLAYGAVIGAVYGAPAHRVHAQVA